MKILYLFSGERRKRFHGEPGIDYPDTQFYGLDYLKDFGLDAEFKEFEDYPLGKIIGKIIGFRARHSLMYFVARKYDVVFGISVIYMLLWKKVFPTKTKFIIFNSVLGRMLNVYGPNSLKFKLLVWILKEADGIIFLAHSHMEKVATRIPFIKDRLYFVPMGVDIKYHKPIYKSRGNFFLSVGRDNARDYKTLFEVAKKMPNEEFHFVCLPRNIEGLGEMPANIKVHTNISTSKLDSLYAKAKALLLITHSDSYTDGSDSSGPTVLLESMAIGLPIIASKKVYVNDYARDGKDILLVDFYDSDAIVGSIHAISDSAMRINMAKSARVGVETAFNTKEMARGLAEVFKTVSAK